MPEKTPSLIEAALIFDTDVIFDMTAPIFEDIENEWITEMDQSACLLYTSPSPRDRQKSRMPSSA